MGYNSRFTLVVPEGFPGKCYKSTATPEEVESLREQALKMGFDIERRPEDFYQSEDGLWRFDEEGLHLDGYFFYMRGGRKDPLFGRVYTHDEECKFYNSDRVLRSLSQYFEGTFRLEAIGEDGARTCSWFKDGQQHRSKPLITYQNPPWHENPEGRTEGSSDY